MDCILKGVTLSRALSLLLLSACACSRMWAQESVDTDKDGLSDSLEQKLLVQFLPTFLIGAHDCSGRPAEFRQNDAQPVAQDENGTIYGQAFPTKLASGKPAVEMHYYHLWKTDCGRHGHPLDAEHVSVLLEVPQGSPDAGDWTAKYWYAAAHESTVCDVSQIGRSSTLHAERHGPTVWISPDKHASYLVQSSCNAGCGADRCTVMSRLKVAAVVNLGELGKPMNGSEFTASNAWPLADKMSQSNFPAQALARLDTLPMDQVVWYKPGKHPAQGIIAISSHTEEHLANAGASTGAAIGTANEATASSLDKAQDSTSNALGKSYRSVKHALGSSAKHVGAALHVNDKDENKPAPQQ